MTESTFQSPAATTRAWHPAVMLIVATIMVLVFAPGMRTPLAQDDFQHLMTVERHGDGVWFSYFEFGVLQYRPTMNVWFAGLRAAFGLDPVAWHCISLVLFVWTVWLLVLLMRRLGISRAGQFAGAVFIACHAALLVWITWTAASNSLLVTFFSLLTLVLLQSGGWRKRVAVPAFALALTSREVAVVLPVLALLTRLCAPAANHSSSGSGVATTDGMETPPERAGHPLLDYRAVWREAVRLWPMWLVLGVYLAIRVPVLVGRPAGAYGMSPGLHGAGNLIVLGRNASGMLVGGQHALVAAVWQTLFWMAMIGASVLLWRGGDRRAWLGLLWFLVGVAPVVFIRGHMMDPHYLDMALPGLGITIGCMFRLIPAGRPVRVAVVCGFACVFWVALCVVAVRDAVATSPVTFQALRGEAMLRDIQHLHPRLPTGATLYLSGADDAIGHALGFGDALRVVYGEPTIELLFEHRGDADDPSFIHLSLRDGHVFAGTAPSDSSSAAQRPPVIIRLHPAGTPVGQGFGVQPDGQSAMSVVCRGATPGTVVVMNGIELVTTFGGPTLVTALVPADLYRLAGHYPVVLRNRLGSGEPVEFVVGE